MLRNAADGNEILPSAAFSQRAASRRVPSAVFTQRGNRLLLFAMPSAQKLNVMVVFWLEG